MKQRYFFIALLLCLVLTKVSQAQNNPAKIKIEVPEGVKPWSSLKINNDPKKFQFLIVTDRTGGLRPGIFKKAIHKINILQPEFVMSVGDLISGYTRDEKQLNKEWNEFNGFIKNLKMPFFYVPGNHDITNEVMLKKWQQLFGKTYYHFVYKDVLFLCLNTEDNLRGAGRGTIDDQQYDYVKKVLAENKNVKWTLVFMHQPLWMQQNTKRWKDVETLLAKRKHSVFVGHIHRYIKFERNNGKYFTLATTGGGSRLRGPSLGEFDHVVWVTMTDEGPVMANIFLEGIWDENVTTEEMAKFAQPLANGNPIIMEPVLLKSNKNFTESKSKIRITNNSDVPMKVDLEFRANTHLLPGFARKSVTLNPNTVEILDLNIKALAKKTKVRDLEPLELKAAISYQAKKTPELSFDMAYHIKPEMANTLKRASKKITIDGDLKDWGNFEYAVDKPYLVANPFSHKGNKDASFKFKVAYDDEYLYVAGIVKDDEVTVNDKTRPYRQDGFHVNLDARDEKKSANGRGGRREGLYIGQSPSATAKVNDKLYNIKWLPKGTKAASRKTKQGFVTEVAIPLSYVKKMQGENWESIRLNVSVTDHDNDNSHRAVLWWRPDWRYKGNYVGSGVFRRSKESNK